jgi:hypothetical protein
MTTTLGTGEDRIASAAYENDWRCVGGSLGDWMFVYYRDPERISVELDNLGRISRASHYDGDRWIPVTGPGKADRVIYLLTRKQ